MLYAVHNETLLKVSSVTVGSTLASGVFGGFRPNYLELKKKYSFYLN